MARRTTKEADADLYERDYLAWVERQVMLLRAGRLQDLDLANLIEEVEDLGRSERHAVLSHIEATLEHLLKLRFSPAREPRRGWRKEVRAHRLDLESRMTATLRREAGEALVKRYHNARGSAAIDLEADRVPEETLPTVCPWTLDQILDLDWLPENVHGLQDDGPVSKNEKMS
jgi:hypothetical protein